MLSAIKSGIDVIVSNPPFVFLPPSQQSVNRDGYGGVFGLEKITYILERLQEYLNPGGRAVILTLSPVINGKDILKEELKKLLDKNYVIDYRIVDYVYNSEFKFFYDSKNISYFIQAILEISKNGNSGAGKIAVQDIPAVKKSFSFVKIIGKKLFAKNYVNAV
jgi:methylase of polypeptide subunit release factors